LLDQRQEEMIQNTSYSKHPTHVVNQDFAHDHMKYSLAQESADPVHAQVGSDPIHGSLGRQDSWSKDDLSGDALLEAHLRSLTPREPSTELDESIAFIPHAIKSAEKITGWWFPCLEGDDICTEYYEKDMELKKDLASQKATWEDI
jgi:hypothetical protein